MKISYTFRRQLYYLQKIIYRIFTGKSFEKNFHNDYIGWILYAHSSPESSFPYKNIHLLNTAIGKINSSGAILEIGVFSGRATNIIKYFLDNRSLNNEFYTVDPWNFTNHSNTHLTNKHKSKTYSEYQTFIKNQFIQNVNFWSNGKFPFSFQLTSDEFFDRWSINDNCTDLFDQETMLGGSIAFCYLDGDHSYEGAKRDFNNIDKYLEINGMILFDDSWELHKDAGGGRKDGGIQNGVYQVVKEALRNNYRIVKKNPNYLLQKFK